MMPRYRATNISLIALLAVGSCVAPGSFCAVVRGPLEFEAATAAQIVETDRPTAEAIDAQNAYWRGNCGAAWGQGYPDQNPDSRDRFTMERMAEDFAYVEYHNSEAQKSGYFPRELEEQSPGSFSDTLTVRIEMLINAGLNDAEVLVVHPPAGWVAIPDRIEVVDGDTDIIELRRGEWRGM